MTYEAIKYLAKFIGYATGLISAGTLLSLIWYGVSMAMAENSSTYAVAKRRIQNLLVAFSISLLLTGGLLTWAGGYLDSAGTWVSNILRWSN